MPDLFREGTLEMSTTPLPAPELVACWGDCGMNRFLLIVMLVLLLASIRDLLFIFPHLLRCFTRWKGNLELEHALSIARTRNGITAVMLLAFFVVADRWALVSPSFIRELAPGWHVLAVGGLFLAYLLLRRIIYMTTPYRSRSWEFAVTLRNCVRNYIILMVTLMLVSVVVLLAFRASDSFVHGALLVEAFFFCAVHILRSGQILGSRCGSFATILYLCALEILPLGILLFLCTL